MQYTKSFSFVLALLAASSALRAEVPAVLDARCPGGGFRELRFRSPVRTYQPTYVGDVDGDGASDIVVFEADSLEITANLSTVLVYGSRDGVRLEDFRRTVFEKEVGGEQIGLDDGGDAPFAPAGDVNGDGYADLLLAYAGTSWEGQEYAGAVFLLFGRKNLPPTVVLTDLAHSDEIVRIVSRTPHLGLGRSVRLAGDINGDGHPDLAIGCNLVGGVHGGDWGGGRVYVLFDVPRKPTEVAIEDVGHAVSGFVLYGAYGDDRPSGHPNGDELGESLAATGDVNGDGIGDLVVGAARVTRGDFQERGAVYVVYGRADFPSELVNDRPEEFGVEILGAAAFDWFGQEVAAVGDVDGDGLQDFIAGAAGPTAPGYAGDAYLIYGSRDWPRSVSVSDPSLRTMHISETPPAPAEKLDGIDFSGLLGRSLSGLGDWNGDGFPDFAIGAPRQFQRFGRRTGAAYIVWGGPGLPASARDIDVGTATLPGARIEGKDGYWELGGALDSQGDFDGDGQTDLLVLSNQFPFGGYGIAREEAALYVVARGAQEVFRLCTIDPPEGSTAGGSTVTLLGNGFGGNETVRFGGTPALKVEVLSSAEIRATVPPRAGPPGRVDVVVTRNGDEATLPAGFEYIAEPPPFDLVLDDGTVSAGPPRILEIRNWSDGPKRILTRLFASTYFGDLNGDGVDDLVIGAYLDGESHQGEVSIVFGGQEFPRGGFDWEDIPSWGVRIQGDPNRREFGIGVGLPGDVNGDGLADLAVGGSVAGSDPVGTGEVFIIRGRKVWEPVLSIREEQAAGRAVSLPVCGFGFPVGPGDLEGQGVKALVLGSSHCEGRDALVQLFLDGIDTGAKPSALIRGEPLPTSELYKHFGNSVAATGDVSGDGKRDFLVGAYLGRDQAFLVLGGDWNFLDAGIEEFLDAGRAVRIRREQDFTYMGLYESGPVGDVDGDGIPDVLLGLSGSGPDFHGETCVVYGSPDLGNVVTDIDLGEPGPWLRLVGEYPHDYSGYAAPLGDLDGDGFADIGVVGADLHNLQARAYVVYGGPRLESPRSIGRLGSRGFRIVGQEGNWFSGQGGAMAAGDLDGDGRRDIAFAEMTPRGKRLLVIFGGEGWGRPRSFVRGEANGDGQINLSDAVAILSNLFLGIGELRCPDAADTNDSGTLNLSDAVYLLSYLYLGTKAPPVPFPGTGEDPTPDTLGPCLR